MVQTESIEQFLARGGKIKQYRSRANEIAASRIPTGKYFQPAAFYAELKLRKSLRQKSRHAGYPAGRIEPGKPMKPWSNRYKKCVQTTPV